MTVQLLTHYSDNMAEVYRYEENVVGCFTHGAFYYGFENGFMPKLDKEPVTIYGQELYPGDKVVSFDSGNSRTSYGFTRGYMTYMGKMGSDLLFEVFDPQEKPKQGNLFSERPKWFLSFAYVGPDYGLLMFSQPGAGYDIHPKQIIKA